MSVFVQVDEGHFFVQDGVDGLQLEWKCPNGRRPRTPVSESGEDESEDEDLDSAANRNARFHLDKYLKINIDNWIEILSILYTFDFYGLEIIF